MSYQGFTAVGLEAFGKGKRVICMDDTDLYELLHRDLALDVVLAQGPSGRRDGRTVPFRSRPVPMIRPLAGVGVYRGGIK